MLRHDVIGMLLLKETNIIVPSLSKRRVLDAAVMEAEEGLTNHHVIHGFSRPWRKLPSIMALLRRRKAHSGVETLTYGRRMAQDSDVLYMSFLS